jgi:hypothetical protein
MLCEQSNSTTKTKLPLKTPSGLTVLFPGGFHQRMGGTKHPGYDQRGADPLNRVERFVKNENRHDRRDNRDQWIEK